MLQSQTRSSSRERPVVKAPNIIVFDSGLGGLTVYREVAAALPHARYLYVADDAFFPYGGRDEQALIARVLDLMGGLIAAHRPDLVIIPCNRRRVSCLST
jgi:glutamate racemase